MPFGKYKNFAHCVNENRDKRNPDAYCATIMRAIEEGKRPKKKSKSKKSY